MAVLIDVECNSCGTIREDVWSTEEGKACVCGGMWVYHWSLTRGLDPGTHPSDKVVLYQSAKEGGNVQYPGRNDVPVPERLRRRGYERIELNVRDLPAFEKRHGVANERRHFNKGNGF
jgi:hypothetical protein